MGMFESIGGLVNDILGGTTSAKMQHKYNKEYAQNAHQWEVKDLQKAGLNPVISAGGSSAGAIAGSSVGSSTNGNVSDLVNIGTGLISTLSQKDLNKSQETLNQTTSAKNSAETSEILAKLPYVGKKQEEEYNKIIAETALLKAQKEETSARRELLRAQKETEEIKELSKKTIKKVFKNKKEEIDKSHNNKPKNGGYYENYDMIYN